MNWHRKRTGKATEREVPSKAAINVSTAKVKNTSTPRRSSLNASSGGGSDVITEDGLLVFVGAGFSDPWDEGLTEEGMLLKSLNDHGRLLFTACTTNEL